MFISDFGTVLIYIRFIQQQWHISCLNFVMLDDLYILPFDFIYLKFSTDIHIKTKHNYTAACKDNII